MFKTRQIVNENTEDGRRLVLAFIDTVDLFEDITASYYDYELLRKKFDQSGILNQIHKIAKQLAIELDQTGIAILTNTNYSKKIDYDAILLELKNKVDVIGY